jgi:hypothetical protein
MGIDAHGICLIALAQVNRAIRMMMGIGMPSRYKRMERTAVS